MIVSHITLIVIYFSNYYIFSKLQIHIMLFNKTIPIILASILFLSECVGTYSPYVVKNTKSRDQPLKQGPCNLSPDLITEIQSYQPIADQIMNAAISGDWKGRTYDELAKFVDKHVNRLTGTEELEASIDYMMQKMSVDGMVNVRGENVQVPRWIRGEEKATLVEPTIKSLRIIGLGPSVGTNGTISAEVIVVRNFDELEEQKDKINGKIVVYNQGWLGSYGETSQYRGYGPNRAAVYGAVAALMESATPYSLDTPHTGGTVYDVNITRIPAACITREDAEFLFRIYSRGDKIVLNLTMNDEELDPVNSRNAIGEILGSTLPEEIVAVSGHIDAWDVGQGAMDDAAGVIVSAEALALIKHLGLPHRRTLQAILWTAEEFGLIGVQAFVNAHKEEMINYKAVLESDHGNFLPRGLDFAGTEEAGCIIQEILKLTSSLNTTDYARYEVVGSDIYFMILEGVPGLSLNTANEEYFYFHHSPADMINVLKPDELDMNTALWAISSYVLADLSVALPRQEVLLKQ